jgi:hypothetical protein
MSVNDPALAIISWMLFIIVPGLNFFITGLVCFQRMRRIQDFPTSKIRSLALGQVEILGTVVPAKGALKDPLTGDKCVYYNWKAQILSGGKVKRYVNIDDESSLVAFYLQDDTGKVLINATDAQIDIREDCDYYSGILKSFPPEVEEFIRSRDMLGHPERFVAYTIRPGDKLYVIGTAIRKRHAGKTRDADHVESIVISKGKKDWFYISDRPENKLVEILRWKAFWSVLGGIFLIAIGITVLVLYLKG